MEQRSMNGGKTRPLTDHAKGVLRKIASEPIPVQEVNPGVRDRFERGGYTKITQYPSPYIKHKGGDCDHYELTEAGRNAIRA